MKHTAALQMIVSNNSEKSAIRKALGKFYTPDVISCELIDNLIQHSSDPETEEIMIIDPFCGDGRLVINFIDKFTNTYKNRNTSWNIFLWDYDKKATELAKNNVTRFIATNNLSANVESKAWDTFVNAKKFYGKFDFVITNPPWEALKPDPREIHSLLPDLRNEYLEQLREYDRKLSEILPYSQPLRKFAGWGTNLSRCGFEVAVNLTKVDGHCGIVIPYALILDQMSINLRKWFFELATVRCLSKYPAETKLFNNVDTDIACLTLQKRSQDNHKFLFRSFDRHVKLVDNRLVSISSVELNLVDYSIPGAADQSILRFMKKWIDLKSLSELEGSKLDNLWLGRELDETKYSQYTKEKGKYQFLKGKMMQRYSILNNTNIFVDENLKQIPPSASYHRIIWRDVSRRSQIRRMQAALIPPFYVTGNSLHVGFFRDGNLLKLRALMCIMNSIPFEFQISSRLGTGHISLGVVRKGKIPALDDACAVERLSDLALEMMNNPTEEKDMEIELYVAKLYMLTKSEFELILRNLNLPEKYQNRLLNHPIWINNKDDNS